MDKVFNEGVDPTGLLGYILQKGLGTTAEIHFYTLHYLTFPYLNLYSLI